MRLPRTRSQRLILFLLAISVLMFYRSWTNTINYSNNGYFITSLLGFCTRWTPRCEGWYKTEADMPSCCRRKLFTTLRTVVGWLDAHNIDWALRDGSIIGALRHGGLIPWDDDVDISVFCNDEKDLEKVQTLIQTERLGQHCVGNPMRGSDPTVYFSCPNRNRVDMYLYMKRGNFLEKIQSNAYRTYRIPKDLVFPLLPCLFEGMALRCPHKPLEYLVATRPGTKTTDYLEPSYKNTVGGRPVTRDANSDRRQIKAAVTRLHELGYPSMYDQLVEAEARGDFRT